MRLLYSGQDSFVIKYNESFQGGENPILEKDAIVYFKPSNNGSVYSIHIRLLYENYSNQYVSYEVYVFCNKTSVPDEFGLFSSVSFDCGQDEYDHSDELDEFIHQIYLESQQIKPHKKFSTSIVEILFTSIDDAIPSLYSHTNEHNNIIIYHYELDDKKDIYHAKIIFPQSKCGTTYGIEWQMYAKDIIYGENIKWLLIPIDNTMGKFNIRMTQNDSKYPKYNIYNILYNEIDLYESIERYYTFSKQF